MRAMFLRWRWAILIAAMMLAGLAFAFWPGAQLVDTGKVTRGPMAVGVTDDGETRVEDLYVVSAPVTGYLSRIELEPGDPVARGALITRMAGRPAPPLDRRSEEQLRAALSAARAGEAAAAATLAQAERDLRRAEQLADRGFVSRAQLEAVRTRVATGRASVEQSRGEVRRVATQLTTPGGATTDDPVAVRAPASGSVLSVISESEGVIAEGTPLVTIGDPSRIEVVVDLLSREAVRVKAGDRVEISQWGGARPLAGHVKRIEPFGKLKVSALGIEEQRVNIIIGFDAASLPQAARLGHGYQVDATVLLWSKPDALRVPIGSLFRGADGNWRVFAVMAGRAEEKAVTLGHLNDEYAEVLTGLTEGTVVVLNPGNALQNASRVKAR